MRLVWVVLLCLLAVYPPRVCACDLFGHHPQPAAHHDDAVPTDGHEHDDPAAPDCPCRCHLAPHDAVTTPRPVIDATDELTLNDCNALAVPEVRFDLKPAVVRCGEPPPPGRHADLPLYLSTSRLRN